VVGVSRARSRLGEYRAYSFPERADEKVTLAFDGQMATLLVAELGWLGIRWWLRTERHATWLARTLAAVAVAVTVAGTVGLVPDAWVVIGLVVLLLAWIATDLHGQAPA